VNATLRGAAKDLHFLLDPETLLRGLNFTFETDIGKINILGEVQGVGGYRECLAHLSSVELWNSMSGDIAQRTNRGKTRGR
jgi:hypothetical protein